LIPAFNEVVLSDFLPFGLPEAVEVAVLIYGNGFAVAEAYLHNGFVFKVDTHTAVLKLDIDEADVVLGHHRVLNAAHLDAIFAVVDFLHNGEVFLLTCLYGVGCKLGHFLAAAEGNNAAINGLNDYVTTVVTLKEFYCHSC